MKSYPKINLSTIELAWRVFTAFYMFRYAMVKITGEQFAYGKGLYSKTVNELSGLDLTWVFFSYSESFAIIIALFQIFGGLLLLFNKTKLLAVVLLFPLLLNILLIDILYAGYPILEAIINVSFYILVLIFICYNERLQLLKIYTALILKSKNPLTLKARAFQITTVILVIILTYVIINFIIKKSILGIYFQSELFH